MHWMNTEEIVVQTLTCIINISVVHSVTKTSLVCITKSGLRLFSLLLFFNGTHLVLP